jgi:hypothetical protein
VELFHIGLTVADLNASAQDFSRSLSVLWRPIVEYPPHDLWTQQRVERVSTRRVYSLAGPPYLELIEDVSGLVWGMSAPGGTHHLGYWSADLAVDGERLERTGGALAITNFGDEPGTRFRYYKMPSGAIIELIPRARAGQILN